MDIQFEADIFRQFTTLAGSPAKASTFRAARRDGGGTTAPGEGRVRAIAMEPVEGMVRGMKAYDLGKGIEVPVGRPTLGRVMNVLGKPVDQLGPIVSDTYYPIHRPAPSLEDQSHDAGNVRDRN